jgi:hypothetical protein
VIEALPVSAESELPWIAGGQAATEGSKVLSPEAAVADAADSLPAEVAPSTPALSETRGAAPAPPQAFPPFHVFGAYRMVPIYRPDLPGAPYQMVPLPPAGR